MLYFPTGGGINTGAIPVGQVLYHDSAKKADLLEKKGRHKQSYGAESAVIFVFLLETEVVKGAIHSVQKVLKSAGFLNGQFLNMLHEWFLLTL